ncbi:hypothetical protein [Comamonas sp.]|uniref:hypothetical protein n=1 Tax=Comamonas sp. TaxID=34028 RepID=UPI003A94B611
MVRVHGLQQVARRWGRPVNTAIQPGCDACLLLPADKAQARQANAAHATDRRDGI